MDNLVQDEPKVLIVQKLGQIEPVDKTWVFLVKAILDDRIIIENVHDTEYVLVLPFDMALLPEDYPFRDIVFMDEPLGN